LIVGADDGFQAIQGVRGEELAGVSRRSATQ
jgi:hypothetical protein